MATDLGGGKWKEKHSEDKEVTPCLLVTDGTLHLEMAPGANASQQAHKAWPDRTIQLQQLLLRSKRHGRLVVVGSRVKQIRASLPLTAVDGASRLALCVKNLASRAHLQLSARCGGGRVQSIGGTVCGCGSGHGGTDGARESSVGGSGMGIVVVGEGAICGGKGRPASEVRAAQTTQCDYGRWDREQAYCQRIARRRWAGVIGGCAEK
jgi:hypothetical protein